MTEYGAEIPLHVPDVQDVLFTLLEPKLLEASPQPVNRGVGIRPPFQHDADPINFPRLLRLGGEEHRSRASEERAAVHHSMLHVDVEEGVRAEPYGIGTLLHRVREGAGRNRAGFMQEASLQAGRSVAERRW